MAAMPHQCQPEERRTEYDARGIPLGVACPECRDELRAKFRPDVLTDPNYWSDEPIEEE